MITIENKLTSELTEQELNQITSEFNHTFNLTRPQHVMLNQYVNNPLGYSYHTIVYEDNIVIGHTAGVPAYYFYKDEKFVLVDGVDAFINKEYRDGEIFLNMASSFFQYLKHSGVKLIIGVPDKNAMRILDKTKFYKKVGNLNTYILPYNIGGIKPKLVFLTPLSKLFCICHAYISSLLASKQITEFCIRKDDQSYNETRYKRMDGNYSKILNGDLIIYYKCMIFKGVRAAFIIDVNRKSAKNFSYAVKYLINNEASNFDVVIYVGNLYFRNHGLIKVPTAYEPKKFNFIVRFLDKSMNCEEFLNIRNWDINLSSYDVI